MEKTHGAAAVDHWRSPNYCLVAASNQANCRPRACRSRGQVAHLDPRAPVV